MSETPTRPQYEFNDRQSQVIADLASGLSVVGVLLLIVGVLYLLGLLASIPQALRDRHTIGPVILVAIAVLIPLSLGVWFRGSAASFRRIVETSGRDIDHLITALDDLRKSFSLMRTIIAIYAALIVIALIAGLLAAAFWQSGRA